MRVFTFILLLGLAGLAGCARGRPPQDPALDASRHRAALATVVVQNGTGLSLVIAFRPAISPGGEVVIGRVEAGGSAQMAPIPADEPIVLRARRSTGEQLELPARSFDMDAEWVWVIPPESVFATQSADVR